MELASQKKEISFKGRGTSVCVAFEGAILPGIPACCESCAMPGAW